MEEISSYYYHYSDSIEYGYNGGEKKKLYEKPNELKKFFNSDNCCPFCKTDLTKVFIGIKNDYIGNELFLTGDVYECSHCGWWKYESKFIEGPELIDSNYNYHIEKKYYALIKKYEISDKEVPLEVLMNELYKKRDILYDISPYKLEEIAQQVLKDVYNCEVKHVGKTGDGGIDLLILLSEEPILVQVKRRGRNKTEMVKGVREFVGTMFIENGKRGIYLTTAQSFSRGSKQLADKILNERKVELFELVDFSQFCSYINLDNIKYKPWVKLVSEFYNNESSIIFDTKDKIKEFEREIEEVSKIKKVINIK